MLVYAQGMYVMHVPFNPSAENPGSQTLYIPGLTFLFTSVVVVVLNRNVHHYLSFSITVSRIIVRLICHKPADCVE